MRLAKRMQSFVRKIRRCLKLRKCRVKFSKGRFMLNVKSARNALQPIWDASGITILSEVFSSRNQPIEKLALATVFISSIVFAGIIGTSQYSRYNLNSTVISMEKDYRSWNTTLPAITMCYGVRVDALKGDEFIRDNWDVDLTHPDYTFILNFLTTISNLDIEKLATLIAYEYDDQFEDTDFLNLTRYAHPEYDVLITIFDKKAAISFKQVMTEMGLCYTVNSPHLSLMAFEDNETISFEDSLKCVPFKSQCFMKLDVFDTDANFYVHSPMELPVYNGAKVVLERGNEVQAFYKVTEIVASDSFNDLDEARKKCNQHSQEFLTFPVYNMNLCAIRCRVDVAIALCGCRPYFYHFIEGTDCTLSGLVCLHKFSWPRSTKVCNCPRTCTELQYAENTIKYGEWDPDGITPISPKSSFSVEILAPRYRLKRDVIFNFEDLLVGLGGAASLCLGFSLLSCAKICFSLIQVIRGAVGQRREHAN